MYDIIQKRAGRYTCPDFKKRGNNMEYELKSSFSTVVRAEKECDVYCPICHKLLHVQAGQVIPRCCGKVMEVLD